MSSPIDQLTIVQLLTDGGKCVVFTRWGRVGEHGQSLALSCESLAEGRKGFEKKFKDKSGLTWADRGANPKPKKYVFVERSYEQDSGDDDDEKPSGSPEKKKAVDEKPEVPPPKCTLDPAVQSLMQLIFNQAYFQDAMRVCCVL